MATKIDTAKIEKEIKKLNKKLKKLAFSKPVYMIYNPLEYALNSHMQYIEKYASKKKKVLFLGMNPGPFGMAQTGVPFGEIDHVKNWMKIHEAIEGPKQQHPKRLIEGFNCSKSEVSGRRLWGFFKEIYTTPSKFFKDHFVVNYCPLAFLGETGKNITPDKIKKEEMEPAIKLCDAFLIYLVNELGFTHLVGIGAYAEKQLNRIFENGANHKISKILHPSPASPAANRGWSEQAHKQLIETGVWRT